MTPLIPPTMIITDPRTGRPTPEFVKLWRSLVDAMQAADLLPGSASDADLAATNIHVAGIEQSYEL